MGTLLRAAPGTEAAYLDALAGSDDRDRLDDAGRAAADALRGSGAVILAGERLAAVPGALSALRRLAAATGARIAWIPRRAGERGAIEAGCLPTLLPGGRPLAAAGATSAVAELWGVELPSGPGRDTSAILEAAAAGELAGLVVGGVDPDDLPDPALAIAALDAARFVVSLELRASAVTDRADVVFPVAPAVHKDGTFVDWEGRLRPFVETLRGTGALPDFRVLDRLAEELDAPLGMRDVHAIRAEYDRLTGWTGERPAPADVRAPDLPRPARGEAVLASWHMLLDDGRLQDGEPYLAGTARRPQALLSAATADEVGAVPGELVSVSTGRGVITLPVGLADLPDRVVWLPANSGGNSPLRDLGARVGDVVAIAAAGPLDADQTDLGVTTPNGGSA
jgi:NADH-quinone oxidoreductase subunit G